MNEVQEAPQQLALELPVELPPAVIVPLRFRLNEATRKRGLQHVAELRRLLAERQAAREAASPQPKRPVRRAA
jgi:hypothetical protein